VKEEEVEALRLQKNRLAALSESDFFDSFEDSFGRLKDQQKLNQSDIKSSQNELNDMEHLDLSNLNAMTEKMEKLTKQRDQLSSSELIKILKSEAPEMLDLIDEFKEKWEELKIITKSFELDLTLELSEYLRIKHREFIIFIYVLTIYFFFFVFSFFFKIFKLNH